MKPHQAAQHTHDYVRHGITSLFAAEVSTGVEESLILAEEL
jgi:hypothetical protein